MMSVSKLYSCWTNFNIILASTATPNRLTQWNWRTACLSNVCYVPCSSHSPDSALLITYGKQQKLGAPYLLRSFLQTYVAFFFLSTNMQVNYVHSIVLSIVKHTLLLQNLEVKSLFRVLVPNKPVEPGICKVLTYSSTTWNFQGKHILAEHGICKVLTYSSRTWYLDGTNIF